MLKLLGALLLTGGGLALGLGAVGTLDARAKGLTVVFSRRREKTAPGWAF